jgi:hypothetical protein
MLDTLSDDLLVIIAGYVDLRTHLCMASTCRTLRRVSTDSRLAYHVTVTPRAVKKGIERWMTLPHIASRIVSLHARRSVISDHHHHHAVSRWLAAAHNVTAFAASFCRVPAAVLRTMPTHMQKINIHRLEPGAGPYGTFFHASVILSRFPHLRENDITFSSGWTHVQLGCHSKTPHLRCLAIRNAPRVLVASGLPDSIRDISIHAQSIIVGRDGRIPDGCQNVTLLIDGPSSSFEDVLPRDASNIRRLDVSCQRRVDIPRLGEMISLQYLRMRFDAIYLDVGAFERLVSLHTLYLESKHCFAVGMTTTDGVNALSRVARVCATSRGRTFDIVGFLRGRHAL